MIHGNWARPQFAPGVSDNVDHMNNNLTTAITAFLVYSLGRMDCLGNC